MTGPVGWPSVSVIVASRGRPDLLRRALKAIRQLDYPAFEIVVVGGAEALAVAEEGRKDGLKTVAFDRANLSVARNMGIQSSAGAICAFIDDDAVPEPTWLRHHAAALCQTGAAASVGYVRGPNGIGFQSRFERIGPDSATSSAQVADDGVFVPEPEHGRCTKLVGTNMAIRREILNKLGGFDPAYRYFLEDSDLSMRLAADGHRVAVVPLAEVHHALAASAHRAPARVMRTLYDIGRSTAIFLRRHYGGDPRTLCAEIVRRERRRLIAAMVRGALEPRDVDRLITTLKSGWAEGMDVPLPDLETPGPTVEDFRPVVPLPSGHEVFSCGLLGRSAALAKARLAVRSGSGRASVFCLALTALPHSIRYTDDGVWVQTGGQCVHHRSAGRRLRWCRFADRVEDEMRRVANCRGLTESIGVSGGVAPEGGFCCE